MNTITGDDPGRIRDFYRAKLAEAFCYSREFSQRMGSVAEAVVETPEFDAVLRECKPGSFECARRVGEMAMVQLDRLSREKRAEPGPWWRDLLNYERGWFLQSATTAGDPPTNRPRRGVSAVCMTFSWKLPEVIASLQGGHAPSSGLQQPATLLFARTPDCKVCVAEVGPTVEKIFRATNGLRSVEQVASAAGIALEDTRQTLEALANTGAVIRAMSPEEMTRRIRGMNNEE